MSAQAKKQRTVFILYVPGGAMMGLIPAITLSRLEELTETPTAELFQVVEGVSTGSILAASFNVQGISAQKGAELFVQIGPKFFPEMPGRWTKMHSRNGLNLLKLFYDLDPSQSDYLAIRNIKQLCKEMRRQSADSVDELIDKLEEETTQQWLSKRSEKKIQKLVDKICAQAPDLQQFTDPITEYVETRAYTGSLAKIFKKAAVGALDGIKNKWAPKEECLYDSSVPEATFKELYGDRKISDTIYSTYISAYDIVNNKVVTFSSLKDDLFSKDPKAPATVTHDIKLWDAVMASIANPFAFQPHITETNLLCSDKATIHKPRSVKDVLAKVDPDTKVVLVIAGTGKKLHSKELMKLLEKLDQQNKHLSQKERYRKKLEFIRDYHTETGMLGSVALGRELAELEGYTTSDALDDFREKLGEENIFDLTPVLTPQKLRKKEGTPLEDREDLPSRDTLDASRENIKKIIKLGRKLNEKEDQQIRRLAQMMVDNLHLLGQMDDAKYERVCRKISGHDDFDKSTAEIEKNIASNDNSTGLRRVWRNLTRKISNGKWGAPPPPPGGPGEP